MGLCGGEWLAVSDVRQEGLRMSEARLELVEPCKHGWESTHCLRDAEGSCPHRRDGSFGPDVECFCPGGSRRVLSVPTDEMVYRAGEALWGMSKNGDPDEDFQPQARVALTAAFNTLGIQETVK